MAIKTLKNSWVNASLDLLDADHLNYHVGGIYAPVAYDGDTKTLFVGASSGYVQPLQDTMKTKKKLHELVSVGEKTYPTIYRDWVENGILDRGEQEVSLLDLVATGIRLRKAAMHAGLTAAATNIEELQQSATRPPALRIRARAEHRRTTRPRMESSGLCEPSGTTGHPSLRSMPWMGRRNGVLVPSYTISAIMASRQGTPFTAPTAWRVSTPMSTL